MKDLFIFPLKEKNINYELLLQIEEKEFKHLTDEETKVLLSWINKRIIDILPKELETLEGCCGYAADLLKHLLKSLKIKHYSININHLLKEESPVHVITIVNILKENNEFQKYILDPTFRQFLETSKCLPNKKNKNGIQKGMNKVIYPGYFLSLSKDKEIFAKKLLNKGYFPLTEDNLKIYTDAFINYKNTCNFRDINYNIEHKQNYMKELYNCLPHQTYPVDENLKYKLQLTPKQLKYVQK